MKEGSKKKKRKRQKGENKKDDKIYSARKRRIYETVVQIAFHKQVISATVDRF